MSRKRTTYSTELKTKLVLELLKEEKTLVEIAKENGIIYHPKKSRQLFKIPYSPLTCNFTKQHFLFSSIFHH